MKKIIALFTLCINLSLAGEELSHSVGNAEEITYDWLVKYGNWTGMTDHIPHFKKIFSKLKIKTLLEFGLGYSTKYFLDSCNKVISVEFITDGTGPDWMKKCIDLYRDYSNWTPIAYFSGYQGDMNWARYKYLGSENFSKAAYYQTVNHKNYALINDFYLLELNAFITNLLKSYKIDLAFVDPGTYLRGDLVQLLFDKVPLIVAHHSSCRAKGEKDDVYGYSRIETPENYEEIFIPSGGGTTLWVVKKDPFFSFIEDLKKYAEDISHSNAG